jgi:signal transduction histidine kinase
MEVLEQIAIASSPFPIVDLTSPEPPSSGLHYPRANICNHQFSKGRCREFYSKLKTDFKPTQCPYGFTVWPLLLGTKPLAITSVIASPGLGGDAERARIQEFPKSRVDPSRVKAWGEAIQRLITNGEKEREEEFVRRLEALHEIRRFNQIIKTNMERACENESPNDLDSATVELVRAHRASGLISLQLDALDLLANPAAAMTFMPKRRVLYRVVDKVCRIYRVLAETKGVRLRLTGYSTSDAQLDERTIHIIPSVFIDNAIKYSSENETIDVRVKDDTGSDGPFIEVSVQSNGPAATEEEAARLFRSRGRGEGARRVAQGSGIGLTLAKIVADQHHGKITASQKVMSAERSEWTFSFKIPRL